MWRGRVLAESEDTVRLEGNHYFPPESLNLEYFVQSTETSVCQWKGQARYSDVMIDGEVNRGAAWYYPDPSTAAAVIKGRVAFWRGVRVEDVRDAPEAGFLAKLRGLLRSGT